MDDPPPLDLTIDQAAVVFMVAAAVLQRMEDRDFDARAPSAAIPRAVMTSGDAFLLVPMLMTLLARLYPALLDDEALGAALRADARPLPTTH